MIHSAASRFGANLLMVEIDPTARAVRGIPDQETTMRKFAIALG
jgi:hypothetical protein